MKFILNESNAKLILDERFILLEATPEEEFASKENIVKDAIKDKKIEINELVEGLAKLLMSVPQNGTDPKAAAAKRIREFEKPCKELVSTIDKFIKNLEDKSIKISSKKDIKAADNFLKIAQEKIYPDTIPTDIEDPELEADIKTATTNIEKLRATLIELFNQMGGNEADNEEKAATKDAPKDLFNSDWTNYIKVANDKTRAWEAYFRAWQNYKSGRKIVYDRIKSLGTAFLQELDKLGFTKANPFLVFLDKNIERFEFDWKNYGTIHNAYVKSPQEVTKETLLNDDGSLIYDEAWYKLNNPNLYAKYLTWQYIITKSDQANKPADIPDEQATGHETILNDKGEEETINTITIDGLTIKDGDLLKDTNILYKEDGKLRDIAEIEIIARFFGASEKKKKELSAAEAENILSKFGMAAHDANAEDLAKLLIYNNYSRVNQANIMRAHDLHGEILDLSNPKIAADNYEKLKNIDNISEHLGTLLDTLVPAKNNGK